MSVVRLEHLTKTFPGGTTAVDDLSLTIGDGEFLVLVGPSGCGKSTVLRMIAGLEDVSGGDIYIDGERVTEWAPKARDIAMVFQNYALYPHMTVRQNMGFALKLQHVETGEAREKVGRTANILGLSALLERKPAALSGGQRQRVAMGRAMVRQPRVFLLDEPLSNLDAKLRVSMRAELARLHHRAPANRFVAGFMGSPSMNFATVRLTGSDDRVTVRLGGRDLEVPDALCRRPGLAAYRGSAVVIGLRPAAFSLAASAGETVVTAVPLGVESLGDEKHILFQAPAMDDGVPAAPTATGDDVDDMPVAVDEATDTPLWTAKVTQHADLAIGRAVGLAVDLREAYFFDPGDGHAVEETETAGRVPAEVAR